MHPSVSLSKGKLRQHIRRLFLCHRRRHRFVSLSVYLCCGRRFGLVVTRWVCTSCTLGPLSIVMDNWWPCAGPALGMHVRGVRPNRAADFRGPPFWTSKIRYQLSCQFERLWCLDYGASTDFSDVEWNMSLFQEPEMLQPDAFCEYTMQQNAYSAPPEPLAGFKVATSRPGGRRKGEGRGEEGKGRRGAGREGGKGRRGEVDSDGQLEQGRRLAKAAAMTVFRRLNYLCNYVISHPRRLSLLASVVR